MPSSAVVGEVGQVSTAKGIERQTASETQRDSGGPMNGEAVGRQCPSQTEPVIIQALPPPPANLVGSSSAAGKNYHVTVSNKAGYMCHVFVETSWPVPPEVPFAIFTHPDNSALFRDVKRVGARKVLKTEPGYKEVEVEQLGDIQVLWMRRTYSTWLHVVEDSRDPECLRITFELLKSDVLGKFSGRWELRPVRDPATGVVVGCRGELNQDVLPKGMPIFMAHLPVLGGALRGISVRAVTRVLEDSDVAMAKVCIGHAAGRSTEAVLRELCGPVSEAAHANGVVNSFAFDAADGEDEGEDEGGDESQEGKAGQEGAKAAGGEEQPTAGGDAVPANADAAKATLSLSSAEDAGEDEAKLVQAEAGRLCERTGSDYGDVPAVVSAAAGRAAEGATAVTVVATATLGAGSC